MRDIVTIMKLFFIVTIKKNTTLKVNKEFTIRNAVSEKLYQWFGEMKGVIVTLEKHGASNKIYQKKNQTKVSYLAVPEKMNDLKYQNILIKKSS